MADDRKPGEPDPDDADSTPYQLGGGQPSGGAGQNPGGAGQNPDPSQPTNPFEAFMSQFGGGDMDQLMAQLQNAFSMLGGGGSLFGQSTTATDSGVNWEVTKDTARKTVASLGSDPTPGFGPQHEIIEAASLAEVWLDGATGFPRVSTVASAWSRAEWIEKTMPVWKRLVEPVATHIADAMAGALKFGDAEEAAGVPGLAGMEQMLRPMLRTSGASMFGLQLGQGLGQLAAEVVGATDIGLPLSEPGHVALVPTNIAKFGEGLEQSSTDVTLYLALRECARQRLFAAAGWLREQMLTLVEEYSRGISIDTSALEEMVGRIDPENLSELSSQLEGGLFEPQKSPEQLVTLDRLETILALVEGWVDDVVTQATGPWMPAAGALAETVRRARASGGPAEATFATLVGLELRPRRMRDAANLWAALREARGAEGRDAVWSHPDLLPTSADLDDPLGFVNRDDSAATSDEDFDAALTELLNSAGETPTDPGQSDQSAGDSGSDVPGHGDDPDSDDPGADGRR